MKRTMYKLIFFLISIVYLFAQATDNERLKELNYLKEQGIITEEDYEVLKQELVANKNIDEGLYDLTINSKLVTKSYGVIKKGNNYYFPIKRFFKYIGFENYKVDKRYLIAYLGNSLREEKIDLSKEALILKDDIYVEANRFKSAFLSEYSLDSKNLKMRVYLSFDTPKEILRLVEVNRENLLREEKEKELIFSSERRLFDLGYARVQLGYGFDKLAGEKYETWDWDGTLSYQGGLLYGEITADYDIRENELNTVRLEYTDIWEGHNFDIENRRYGKTREWGFAFYKNKGYYEEAGGEIVISESVPIGSKAELIYMGTPIEIQNDVNGVVTFSNPLIRTDRTYTLKIYEPTGKIIEKEIKTVKDYYLQKKRWNRV